MQHEVTFNSTHLLLHFSFLDGSATQNRSLIRTSSIFVVSYSTLFSLEEKLRVSVFVLEFHMGDHKHSNSDRVIESFSMLGHHSFLSWRRRVGIGYSLLWTWSWTEFSFADVYGVVSEVNELLRVLTELARLESVAERSAWVSRNYRNVLALSKSLSTKFFKAFRQSGVMREIGETFQKEVVEGGLIRDCLELGNNDLKALIQVFKDLLLQFLPARDRDPDL
ncbi:hypothetical protein Fmac_009003 [Flemingia macrophylla]|uniref:Uncharacterized protein n=1 Tax=Flemingia macrophylla TaxID=520843 RepID=A0ABD1MZ33_9FABA